MLGLDAVLVGIAVLVLAKLILGVELIGGWGHWLRDRHGLADQVGLGYDGLVDNVLLGIDSCGVDLGLVDNVLGLGNDLLNIGLGLGNNLLNISLWLSNNLRLNDNLRGSNLLNGNLWLGNVLNRLSGLNCGDSLLLWRLVGDGLSDQLEVLLPGSDNFRGVLNLWQ